LEWSYVKKRLLNKLPFLHRNKQCPICLAKFHTFLPLSKTYPGNWKKYGFPYHVGDFETLAADTFTCPECGSTDRDRLFCVYLSGELTGKPGLLLDIAPSKPLSNWIRKNLMVKYVTADLFMQDVDYTVDIQNMNVFENNTFDFLICSHVLEHVPDDRKAMSEIYRILKKGGKGIVMVPIVKEDNFMDEDPAETNIQMRWKRFGQDDHIRLYSQSAFCKRLSDAGFVVSQIPVRQMSIDTKRYGVSADSVLYIVTK
jgi:SAM-dependent methyltransferase